MALSESSTTETKTYILEKYSRAYAKDSGNSEWQHFTNPVLRLILDTKQSAQKAESLRMRIVWTMNGGPASGAAQQEVVLEDLDLLAFSSPMHTKSDSSPLKGVYRDTTFGLRYLHVPDSSDSQKVYRRFQISFSNSSAALQLVEAIRDVCPCKPTEPSAPARKRTVAPLPSRAPQVPVPPNAVANAWDRPVSSVAPAPTQLQRLPIVPRLPNAPIASPFTSSPGPFTSTPSLILSSQPKPPGNASGFPSSSPAPSPYRPLYEPSSQPAPTPPSAAPLPGTKHLDKPTGSLPDSSPPSCSADSTMMPPPPPPPPSSSGSGTANANANAAGLVEALREVTGLYDLSHAALERLVGDVVREDRFGALLENLSSMWAMKAAVGP